MAGRLTLTSPIPVANIRFVDCVGRVHDNPDVPELTVDVEVRLTGNLPMPFTESLTIRNGFAEGIRAKVSPTGAIDHIEKFGTASGVATAYTQARADFASGGRNGLMTRLQTLGLLPAGSIA